MIVLYAESFAPWCEKARWALDHHRVHYSYREHVPLFGEITLRMATRRLLPRATIPLLITESDVLMDSFGIARYAERRGSGSTLFPDAHEAEIHSWNACSEVIMTHGRSMLLPRLSRMPDALREQLPTPIPRWLRGAFTPIASFGVEYLKYKYQITVDDARHERASREALGRLRLALADGRDYILGHSFSFADIAMATSLQFVKPVAGNFIELGPATRVAWTNGDMARDYPDLLQWRDRLYELLRRRCSRSSAQTG